MDIRITNITQSVQEWEEELNKALDPGWFDCITRHLAEYGAVIENELAKRKACYVRCARSGCYSLHARRYKEDFGEDMPLHQDGKDYRAFITNCGGTVAH